MDALTERQRGVAELLAKGLTNKEIAGVLAISAGTVRTHVTAILEALEVSNRTEVAGLVARWSAANDQLAQVMSRPAILVRPLEALAPDPVTGTLARGLASDLSALFARHCWFPVIGDSAQSASGEDARGSVLIGRELGARFVVGGTLRPARQGWRLVAFADDVSSSERIWSEVYDLDGDQVFEIQEEVTAAIVATVYPVLLTRAVPSGADVRASSMSPWLLAHQGMQRLRVRSAAAARDHFLRALERDDTYVLPQFGLGLTAYYEMLNQWRPAEEAREELAVRMARCIALAPHVAEGYYLQGRHAQSVGDHESACAHLKEAIRRNPSMAAAHSLLAQEMALLGQGDEALQQMTWARRLSPGSYVAGLATVHFARGDYELCYEAATAAMTQVPGYPYAHMLAALSAWHLGNEARARTLYSRMRRAHPAFHPRDFVGSFCSSVPAGARVLEAAGALDR